MMRGNTSLYVMAFWFPMTANFLSASTIQARNSRKSENGGFVTMISASSRKAFTSSERKSPSPFR